jgi:type I pantothenate kinase
VAGEVKPAAAALSRYVRFPREAWAPLRAATPLTLSETDLAALHGINERVSLDEVVLVYLPLSRLLNLRVAATQGLHAATDAFLGRRGQHPPYIIGLAGSVAVGKSTTARVCRPCSRGGRIIRASTSSPPTASCIRTPCSTRAA